MPTYSPGGPYHGQTLGTVTFTSSGFKTQILKLDIVEVSRKKITVTNMQVNPTTTAGNYGNEMHLPSAYINPGTIRLKINHDPSQAKSIPLTNLPETITIALGPGNNQQTLSCLGWLQSYNYDGPLDGEALTATMDIVLTDVLIVASGSYSSTGAVSVGNATMTSSS
jgi:hypothetical protein